MDINQFLTLFFALLGGGIPPLIWLWFWIKEDKNHPEPKPLIIATFVGGMIAVPIAFVLEKKAASLGLDGFLLGTPGKLFAALVVLVLIEEIVKYLAAQGIAFPNKHFDEPVDAIIYMISAALGFAALENTLFLIDGLSSAGLISQGFFATVGLNEVLINNNLRFIGANVLHVVASGLIGVFIGFSFYKHWFAKILYFLVGLGLATFLHAIFNFSIITYSDKPLVVFSHLWLMAILLIFLFERVKRVRP
ncbi:hypothetical protein CL654_01555 [bacterium]|nr:hypothetical protein [bacterium]|tara:strand:+ start:4275 stop:5021 length:747 start_codon:yes stop_codon:yes gene_type:complete